MSQDSHPDPQAPQLDPRTALVAPIGAPAVRPERRMRSLVDGAHEALTAALDAARLAGRVEALLDMRPSDTARDEYDRCDHRAVLTAEHAHAAVDALVRGPQS